MSQVGTVREVALRVRHCAYAVIVVDVPIFLRIAAVGCGTRVEGCHAK